MRRPDPRLTSGASGRAWPDPFRRRGAALVLVLWAVAILALLASGLSFAIKQDLAVASIQRDRLVAHHLARAGLERAVAEIMDDARDLDTLDETWSDDEEAFGDVELAGGTFRVYRDDYEDAPGVVFGARDESAKLNLNAATREQLMKLPHMTEAIAAAILDWRDADGNPELDGAEAGYYTALAHPYEIRDGPLRTLRELLLVRGVTTELLYGEDANGNGLLDPNENDGDTTEPPDNADGMLDRGWSACVTVWSYEKNENASGQTRLNLNKAGAGELSQRLKLESWAAESIVKAREKKQFEHLVDLLKVQRDPSVKSDPQQEDAFGRGDAEKDQPVTQAIFRQIVDDLTLKDDKVLPGRINLNTAPHGVLRLLPGVEDELADAIIRHRNATGGLTTIGDLLSVQGISTDAFGKLEDCVTVRSNVFRIQSEGRAASGLAAATIDCIVDRGGDAPRVLYWLESSP